MVPNGCRNILLQRKKLVAADVDLVTSLERSRDNAFLRLHGEVDLVDGAKNLIDLTDRGLRASLVSNGVVSGAIIGVDRTLFSR